MGHVGTHFDVMDKIFPLEYLRREVIVFDVAGIDDREIATSDIDMSLVECGMFVAFRSGDIEREGYGNRAYFTQHPVLNQALIDMLLDKEISIIGINFAGVRRGS